MIKSRHLRYQRDTRIRGGARIVIVAGTRAAAVMQAAEVASDTAQLDQLAGKANGQGAFEALCEVRTLGKLNLGPVSCSHARCGWAACGDLIGPIKPSPTSFRRAIASGQIEKSEP